MSSADLKGKRLKRLIDPPLTPIGGEHNGTALPLYEQVKQRISERIVLGQWPPGYVLPAENDVADMLQVSVGTVRRALGDLTKEGLVVRHPRTGTVVTGRSPHHTMRHFYQYFRLHEEESGLAHSQAKVLKTELTEANEVEARALRLRSDHASRNQVIRIDRLRLVDGQAVMRDLMVLPMARVPGFPTQPADLPALIYRYLLDRFGIRIAGVRENLTAEPASDDDRALLSFTEPGQPNAVLVIEEVAFDPQDVPIVYAVHRATTERFKYVNEVR